MVSSANNPYGKRAIGTGMKSNKNMTLSAVSSIQGERMAEPAGQAQAPIGIAPSGCPPEYRQLDAAYFKAVATGGRHSR